MKIGVYSGSFDPLTKGHIEILERSKGLVDKLIILVLNNPNKKYMFSLVERTEMIKKIFQEKKSIQVENYEGLLVDFMKKNKCNLIIRGLRAVSDYEYELGMALVNKDLSGGEIETVFLPASREQMYISSTMVREIALNGGNLEKYVDSSIENKILEKLQTKK
jgi:pantetheine-phosphate adenylyltransferase